MEWSKVRWHPRGALHVLHGGIRIWRLECGPVPQQLELWNMKEMELRRTVHRSRLPFERRAFLGHTPKLLPCTQWSLRKSRLTARDHPQAEDSGRGKPPRYAPKDLSRSARVISRPQMWACTIFQPDSCKSMHLLVHSSASALD